MVVRKSLETISGMILESIAAKILENEKLCLKAIIVSHFDSISSPKFTPTWGMRLKKSSVRPSFSKNFRQFKEKQWPDRKLGSFTILRPHCFEATQ